MRISNGTSDYSAIGSCDPEANNTRITLFGGTHPSAAGQISYVSKSTGSHVFFTTDSNAERLRITSTGNVGIGTATVNAKLHVEGTTRLNGVVTFAYNQWHTSSDDKQRVYFNLNGTTHIKSGGNENSGSRHIEFRTGNDMVLGYFESNQLFYAYGITSMSDSRIKKDIEDINDEEALNKILLIQPTKYNYVDKSRNKEFGKVYGFIAQQIREVIPEAINITQEIIPNIYKSCLISNKRNVYHSIPLDIAIDTEVQILETEGGKGDRYKIKEVYSDHFVIDKDIDVDEAFVYGYYINDLHSLDKNYIFTLNVCATQELHRRIETQSVLLKSQDDRIKDLETKVATLMGNTT